MADNLGIRLKDRPVDATVKVPAYASYWDNTTDLLEDAIENLIRQGLFEGLLTSPQLSRTNMVVSFETFQCMTEDGIYCSLLADDVTHEAADATNPRIDIICVVPTIQKTLGEIVSTGAVAITKGTAAAKPLVPETSSGYLKIAEVDVPAAASAVTLRNWKPMYIKPTMLRPLAQDTPDMTIRVNFFRGYINSATLLDADAQDSPTFTAPAANKCRLDILHINSSGTLAITQGTEVNRPTEPSAPSYPTDKLVICEVFLEEGDTAIYQWQIKDVRPYWWLVFSAGSIGFTPAGNIVATNVQAAIEELDDEKLASSLVDFVAPTELTIADGAITITQTFHTVDTEGDAGSDDLVTINGEATGRLVVLKAVNDAHTVVVKHNTGNIWLKDKVDLSLDDLEDGLLLIYTGTKWIDLGPPGAGISNIVEDITPQLGGDLDAQTKRIYDIKWLDLKAPTELTIATGVITVTQSFHTVDTESDDVTDDLVTINGGSVGRILIIRAENDAHSVVVKHGTGNIWLKDKADLTLDDLEDSLVLVYTAGSKWVDIGVGSAAVATTFLALTDTPANFTDDGLKYLRVNVGENALEFVEPTVQFSFAIPIDTPETVANDVGVFHFAPGVAGTIEEVYLMAKTAPGSGKTLTVDVNKGGTTIFTTQGSRPSLVDTATTDTSDEPDVTTFAKNDLFTIDVDVSTAETAVADAILYIRGKQKIA